MGYIRAINHRHTISATVPADALDIVIDTLRDDGYIVVDYNDYSNLCDDYNAHMCYED